jgi:ABC-2 type transport system ATP-binding protein
MIQVDELTKRYGTTTAVDDLSFRVEPGKVTGFLGPNGAGKSTTMRLILGLDAPSSGTATVNGRPLAGHDAPITHIGTLLDAKAVHPRRSARNHLRALAATSGVRSRRVDEVLALVGIEEVADRAAGSFSLGMGQRLGIASALLGDPGVVMLDEPVNGLDPEGILWIRSLLRHLADEGRTVFVSSHLMSEMAMIADHYVIVGRGRLIADVSAAELEAMAGARTVRVRTPQPEALTHLVAAAGGTATPLDATDGFKGTASDPPSRVFEVTGLTSDLVGARAAAEGIALFELTPQQATLEDVFMELTRDAVQYHAAVGGVVGTGDHSLPDAARRAA